MRGEPIKHPRKVGEHVSRCMDMLTDCGGRNIRVWKTTHLIIGWQVGEHYFEITCACTPRDEGQAFKWMRSEVRRVVAAKPGALGGEARRAWEGVR